MTETQTGFLGELLQVMRDHVVRATKDSGLSPAHMSIDIRFGLRSEEATGITPVLRTPGTTEAEAPHSLHLKVSLPAESPEPAQPSE